MSTSTHPRGISHLQLVLLFVIGCYLSAASTCVEAQSTQIAMNYFYSGSGASTCTGTNFTQTYAAGACQSNSGSYSSYFCSTDGQYIYIYLYSDATCAPASTVSIVQYPTTCGWVSTGLKYTCINPTAGPAAPLSFPPSGWAQATTCQNITSNTAATVCSSSDPNIHCSKSASLQGVCQKTGSAALPYSITGCTTDLANFAVAYYSDSNCTILAQVAVQPAGCYGGTSVTCGSYTFPQSIFPTKGFTQYDNAACGASTSTAPITTLFTDGCANSQTFSCSSSSGVNTGTYTTFSDTSGQGKCPGTGTTVTQPAGVCQNKKVFVCPSGGSSGSASSSSTGAASSVASSSSTAASVATSSSTGAAAASTSSSSSTSSQSATSSTASSTAAPVSTSTAASAASSTAASSTVSSSSTGAASATGSSTAASASASSSSTGAAPASTSSSSTAVPASSASSSSSSSSTAAAVTAGSSGASSGNFTSSTGTSGLPLSAATTVGVNHAFAMIVAIIAVLAATAF